MERSVLTGAGVSGAHASVDRPRSGPAGATGNVVRAGRLLGAATLALVATICAPLAAGATTSRDVVLANRSGHNGAPPLHRRGKSFAVEICQETCDYYEARQMRSEDELWDVVFLHQAFFDAGVSAKSFRAKHAAHVSAVMAAYARNCSKYPQDATRATCIVKFLARRNGISYAFVRYEPGQRCEVAAELLSPAFGAGKRKCAPAKGSR